MNEEIFDVRFLSDSEISIENKLSRMRAQKYIGKSVKLKVFSDTRSLQQNRYLWSIFKIIGDELGYNKEDVKDLILMELKFEITYVWPFTTNREFVTLIFPFSYKTVSISSRVV